MGLHIKIVTAFSFHVRVHDWDILKLRYFGVLHTFYRDTGTQARELGGTVCTVAVT